MGSTDREARTETKLWEAKDSSEIKVNSSFNDTTCYYPYKMGCTSVPVYRHRSSGVCIRVSICA